MNRKDLWASTLVRLTQENSAPDTLPVLNLDNHLFMNGSNIVFNLMKRMTQWLFTLCIFGDGLDSFKQGLLTPIFWSKKQTGTEGNCLTALFWYVSLLSNRRLSGHHCSDRRYPDQYNNTEHSINIYIFWEPQTCSLNSQPCASLSPRFSIWSQYFLFIQN